MTDIQGLISSLRPEDLAVLQQRGPDQLLGRDMLDAIDRAAGGPGEGHGDDVAAIFAPSALEGAEGADA